jgi:hypothetical protein
MDMDMGHSRDCMPSVEGSGLEKKVVGRTNFDFAAWSPVQEVACRKGYSVAYDQRSPGRLDW